MLVCDGLTGLPDAVNTVWPDTIVQTCIVHLMRNSFKYAARQDWDAIARALKPIYQAATLSEAEERFLEFQEAWGDKYPAIVRLWNNAWAEFVPFLGFDRLPPPHRLHDQRDRVRQRPHPQCRPSPRALLERASRAEMRLPRRDGPRPHRQGTSPVDAALEAGPRRVRHPLRRPPQHTPQLNQSKPQAEIHR